MMVIVMVVMAIGIQWVFNEYAPNGGMESKNFMKMIKDCNLINNKLTTGDIDLIFSKCKSRASGGSAASGAKVNFEIFMNIAVPAIAEKRGKEHFGAAKFIFSLIFCF